VSMVGNPLSKEDSSDCFGFKEITYDRGLLARK